jgi:DNA polymerase III epsilon subunit-like protein
MLASVCVVNAAGNVLYASLVRPQRPVTDYRTQYSGVTAEMLADADAREFHEVRAAVKAIIAGRIVVGHSVDNDFVALGIDHPAALTRDTAHDLRRLKEGRRPKRLRVLVADFLGLRIQRNDGSGHDPAEDARASLYLYLAFRGEFEDAAARRNKRNQWRVSCRSYQSAEQAET